VFALCDANEGHAEMKNQTAMIKGINLLLLKSNAIAICFF
jgi:hypothetical protein